MPNNIKISLKSKPETSVTLLISDEVKNIVQSSTITPSINFIATGERGLQGETGTASISDNSIVTSHLEDNSITNSKIAASSISTSKLGYGAVSTSKIKSGAVTTQKIADSSISASKLKPNSVNATHIQNGTIIKELITDLSLPGGKLEDSSIGTIKILDNAVTKDKIASKTISGEEMQDNIVLGGTTHVVSIQIDGSSPGYINGPDEDLLYIKSKKDLIFVVDSDENSHNDISSFKFQNFAGTNLLELNESGHASLSGDLNVQGNININGLVDGIDISGTLVSVTNNLNKINLIGITQSVDLDSIEADVNLNTAKTGITTSQADAITANTAKPDLTVDGAGTVHSSNYTDTVYTHPSSHPISLITGLQTALNAKQDTIEDGDLTIAKVNSLQVALNGKVNGNQVLTNVPINAVFTDTVYAHPANHAISVITGLQSALDAKQDGIGDEDLTIAMTDGLQAALNGKVDDSQVLTNVPANAVFTDTNTTYSVQDGELSQNNFTDADHSKLNNIEANATADQTQAEINALGITATGIAGPTDGDVLISTDGSISVILDNDNDESNQYFEIRNSATGSVFSIREDGSVTLDGTVDGRDVAADGTKLDGIESGATADQTKADIDALGISASSAISLTVGNKTIVGNLIITGTVDGIDIATDVAANTLKTSFPGFGTTAGTALEGSTTIPTQYTDALAVHAVENATLTLDNDLTVDSGFIYIHDQASTAKSRIGTETLTGNQTVYLPDASGTMALTNKTIQQFNLSFADDIGSTQHYLSWRDQYEQSNISSDLTDTNYLVPANGRVKCVYMRVGTRVYSRTMTVRVYSQNAGFMQSQVQQESEATSISSSDDFEVFAFYFDNAEHFQAGDSIKISVQDSADSGNTQIYHVTAVLEFDYTQMGRTTSGELA